VPPIGDQAGDGLLGRRQAGPAERQPSARPAPGEAQPGRAHCPGPGTRARTPGPPAPALPARQASRPPGLAALSSADRLPARTPRGTDRAGTGRTPGPAARGRAANTNLATSPTVEIIAPAVDALDGLTGLVAGMVHQKWTTSLPPCGRKPKTDPVSPAAHHRETHSPSAPVPLTHRRCRYATSPPGSPGARPELPAAPPTLPLPHRRHRAA
jgi:hypothetical protein